MIKPLLTAAATAALLLAGPLHAQAQTTQSKKDLVARVIQLQQPALESPLLKRFQVTLGESQRGITEKTVADSRSSVEPRLRAFQEATAKRLGIAVPAAPAASGTKK